jgi:hypothetical protein
MYECDIKIKLRNSNGETEATLDIKGDFYLPHALKALMDTMKAMSTENVEFSNLVSDLSYELMTRTDKILEEEESNG